MMCYVSVRRRRDRVDQRQVTQRAAEQRRAVCIRGALGVKDGRARVQLNGLGKKLNRLLVVACIEKQVPARSKVNES